MLDADKLWPNTLYYMIRLSGGHTPMGANFQGFGDPDVYGYALGDNRYTNIVRANSVPEGVAFWELSGLRVSIPGVQLEDARELVSNILFSFSILEAEGAKVLYAAPFFVLPNDFGMSLMDRRPDCRPVAGLGRHLGRFSGQTKFGCRLRAALPVTFSKPVEVYILADFALKWSISCYYEGAADTKGDGT